MSWRTVVVTGSAKLEYKLEYLVIRKLNQVSRVHLSEIGILLVDSTAVSMTAVILCELIKHKVKVIFCDEKHNPLSELQPYYGSHDTSLKVKQQMAWTKETKDALWARIIADKISKQAHHLLENGFDQQAELLYGYVDQIQPADATNREGHAAKVYFNALFGKSFSRNGKDPINSALDYGYGLLLSSFNKELAAGGYITQIGVWHDNQFNQFNLSSDLMETFRVVIDRYVYLVKPEKFEKDEKLALINLLNESVLINGKSCLLSNAIKIYCKSAVDALNANDPSLLKKYTYEL